MGVRKTMRRLFKLEASSPKPKSNAQEDREYPEDPDQPITLAQIGSHLAVEARKWALEGPSSLLETLQQPGYSKFQCGAKVRFELYVLLVAAFVEATLSLGDDGVAIQVFLLEAACDVGRAILGKEAPSREDVGRVIETRLDHYSSLSPALSMGDMLKFGHSAAEHVLGPAMTHSYAAITLVHGYVGALSGCSDLLASVLGEA